VIGFRTDDEAVALANGTPFGLTSSVWTADSARGWTLADRIEAGVTFVNAHGMAGFDVRAPFGGVKGSGYGREMGKDGLLEFTVPQQAREPRPM
jgi:acyl-CoA reductase-like NAD-dependent aldehyde dehydrogenase